MKRKLNVCVSSEANFLNSGFSNIAKGLLERLHATGKYNLIEIASYASVDDSRCYNAPWKIYPTIPSQNDQQAMNVYNSTLDAQFGSLVLEKALLECRVDALIEFRDHWMSCAFQQNSPFRKLFKYIHMPMQDSKNSPAQYYDDYAKVDVLLSACPFARRTYKNEYNLDVQHEDVNFSVDHKVFYPMDKQAIRKQFGIPIDANIIMKCARLQPRKDFAGLLDAFRDLLSLYIEKGEEQKANQTYLLLNTSFPDVGIALDKHILRAGIGHRVLLTHICQACHNFWVGPFETEITFCRHCGKLAAHLPNTGFGLTREQLAITYNMANLYVQVAIAEGVCMPFAEAKACGVPAIGTDYAALEDQVRDPGSMPIKVIREYWEPDSQTGQKRVMTDVEDITRQMYNFFSLSPERRAQMGQEARKVIEEKWNYDRAAKIFEKAIDNLEVPDHSETWLNPNSNFAPNSQQIPQQFKNNSDFLDWCIDNILGKPELKVSYWKNEMLKGLNTGVYIGRYGKEAFGPQSVVNIMRNMANKQNFWEQQRLNIINPQPIKPQWELV